MQTQQIQTSPQQESLTKQVVQQLVQLLKDPKIQVKYGSLNAILSYSKSQQQKKLFQNTELFSQINKVLNNQKLTTICLSTLIHFSSMQIFQKQYIRFVEPLIFNLKQWKNDLRQQLSLLCLLNISKYDSIIQQIIGQGQKKGFLLQVLYGFIQIKQNRRWVITNIFVNVTSIQIGRKHITQQKIYLRFMNYINTDKQTTRLGILKLLRNCSFEWQNQGFVSQILKDQHDFINKLGQHMLYIIEVGKLQSQAQGNYQYRSKIMLDYQPIKQQSQKIIKTMQISSKAKALGQICLVIDILLILSNSNFGQRKVSIKQDPLRQIISILKFSDLSQQYKDKLQALEIFCFY